MNEKKQVHATQAGIPSAALSVVVIPLLLFWFHVQAFAWPTEAPTCLVQPRETNDDMYAQALDQIIDIYRKAEFSAAEKQLVAFSRQFGITKKLRQKAMFYEAECLRAQCLYPAALERYKKLTEEFEQGGYRKDALCRIFDIANYWADDLRDEMQAKLEKDDWAALRIRLRSLVHLDKTKPLWNSEGQAVEALKHVAGLDSQSWAGEKSRFFLGRIHFYRKRFCQAADCFKEVTTRFPKSAYAKTAKKMTAVINRILASEKKEQ